MTKNHGPGLSTEIEPMHTNHGNTTVGTKNSTTGTNGAANGSGVTPPDSVMNGSLSEVSLMDVVEVALRTVADMIITAVEETVIGFVEALLALPLWATFIPLVVFIVAIVAVHQTE